MNGVNGFLGTRGSIMLDFVFLAMFAVVPVLAVSVYLVKVRHQYQLHKTIQILLGVVLLLAVTAFEVDMRFYTDWRQRAEPSPYFQNGIVWKSLWIHLSFAIPTTLLWVLVIVCAVRNFPHPPAPNSHSESHKFWSWTATIGMVMTAVTGWIFYWLAFMA